MDHERLGRLLTALQGTDHDAPVLRRLCLVCVDHVGADGATVTSVGGGTRRVVDASDADVARVAALQFELADGPCVDAIDSLTIVSEADLTSPDAVATWPRFAPAARRHGVVAAFAFPLLDGRRAVGTLDLYNRRSGPLGPDRTADASILADLAALALEQADRRAEIADVGIRVEPEAPWAHRAVVHHASGMVAEQLGLSVEEALLRLRALAFVHGRGVEDLSRAIVARELSVERWARDD